MDVSTFRMRCPHLDRLTHELIEAYRSLEDHEIFVTSFNPQAPSKSVTLIHQAMATHRQTCVICNFTAVGSDQTAFTGFVRQ